jgi:molybdopterin converting factor subunit 1
MSSQTVRVRLFARAKDLLRSEDIPIEVGGSTTVGELRRLVKQRYPMLADLLQRSAIAVNEEFAADDVVLGPQMRVALIPPVSGG